MLEIVSGDIIEVANKYKFTPIVNPTNKKMNYGSRNMWCNL